MRSGVRRRSAISACASMGTPSTKRTNGASASWAIRCCCCSMRAGTLCRSCCRRSTAPTAGSFCSTPRTPGHRHEDCEQPIGTSSRRTVSPASGSAVRTTSLEPASGGRPGFTEERDEQESAVDDAATSEDPNICQPAATRREPDTARRGRERSPGSRFRTFPRQTHARRNRHRQCRCPRGRPRRRRRGAAVPRARRRSMVRAADGAARQRSLHGNIRRGRARHVRVHGRGLDRSLLHVAQRAVEEVRRGCGGPQRTARGRPPRRCCG